MNEHTAGAIHWMDIDHANQIFFSQFCVILTSTVASAAHPVIGSSSADHVVAAAAARRPVVGAGSLHAHGLPLRLIVGPHLSTATLEDLNVPTSMDTPQ